MLMGVKLIKKKVGNTSTGKSISVDSLWSTVTIAPEKKNVGKRFL